MHQLISEKKKKKENWFSVAVNSDEGQKNCTISHAAKLLVYKESRCP